MAKPVMISRKSKDILRALMNPAKGDTVPWSSGDLRAILDHQLAVPLEAEADRLAECCNRSVDQVRTTIGVAHDVTFGDVLEGTACAAALKLVKDYARASLKADGDLPRDVARVLYIMAIIRGRRVGQQGISSLDDLSLARERQRCLTFGWLPEPVRDALR